MIPEEHLSYYLDRCRELGSRSAYLTHLVANYLPRIQEWKTELDAICPPNWHTIYQAGELNLVKKNFKPRAEDWECLRNAAATCGVSMCFLFVFLMNLESIGFFEKSTDEKPGRMELLIKWMVSWFRIGKFSKFGRKLDLKKHAIQRQIKIR